MSTEANKTIARRFVEASAASDQAPLKEILAPDFVAHQPYGPQNREVFLQHLKDYMMAFSENNFIVEEQIAERDQVVTRATWQAVHSGEFQGLPPSGKQITIDAILIERIEDGVVVEHRGLFDQLSLMQQIGLVPARES